VQFLPSPMVNKRADGTFYLDDSHAATSIGKVHSTYGNFAVNVRAFIYIKMLGSNGLKRVSENAIINANYIMRKLEPYYHIAFPVHCMHEFVASGEEMSKKYGIKTLDIAKRLLDKGFHAPTIYFPLIVHEAIMVEPTETESMETLDMFINAMIEIAHECETDPDLVKHAPHSTPVKRVDDVRAVKELNVRYEKK
jgi:glycine dehydrogenase subunit 2